MQVLRTFGIFVVLFLPLALFAQGPNADEAAKEQQRRLTAIIDGTRCLRGHPTRKIFPME